jgi:hypothetical protein
VLAPALGSCGARLLNAVGVSRWGRLRIWVGAHSDQDAPFTVPRIANFVALQTLLNQRCGDSNRMYGVVLVDNSELIANGACRS